MSKFRKITKKGKICWKPNQKMSKFKKVTKKGRIGGNPT